MKPIEIEYETVVFMKKTLEDKLRERKEKTGLPVSWQVRTAVDKYLEDND